jgi:hypothetical protein
MGFLTKEELKLIMPKKLQIQIFSFGRRTTTLNGVFYGWIFFGLLFCFGAWIGCGLRLEKTRNVLVTIKDN